MSDDGTFDRILAGEDVLADPDAAAADRPQVRRQAFRFTADRDRRPGVRMLQITRLDQPGWKSSTLVDLTTADKIALREAIDRDLDVEVPCSCGGGFSREATGDGPVWIPHERECVYFLEPDERVPEDPS